MDDLQGLVALVTGAASGIGAATARELTSRGALVASLDRTASDVEGVASFTADLTDDRAVRAAVEALTGETGALDVLVNNAGVGIAGGVESLDDATWHRVYDVNVLGLVRATRAALPWLRRSPAASIVNTCSSAAVIGLRDRALYSATKGAVAALTSAMAADYFADGIRVNAVAPGTVDTPLVRASLAAEQDPVAAAHALEERQRLGRFVTAEEVAVAIAYLASPRAGSTTGVLLPVDGGLTRLPDPGTWGAVRGIA